MSASLNHNHNLKSAKALILKNDCEHKFKFNDYYKTNSIKRDRYLRHKQKQQQIFTSKISKK